MNAVQLRLNKNYVQIDRLMLPVLGALFVMALALSGLNDTLKWAMLIGLPAGLIPAALIFTAPGSRLTRAVVAASLMIFSALHIHQAGGLTELHFGIFVLLAFLLIYRDWFVIIVAAVVAAVHHLSFNYLQEWGYGVMCFTKPGILIVLMHAAYVVVEAGVLTYLAILLHREARQSAELDAQVISLQSAGSGEINLTGGNEQVSSESAMMLQSILGSMRTAIIAIRSGAGTISVTAEQLSRSTGKIAMGSQAQSEAAMTTAAAVEEITVGINSVAANSDQVQRLSQKSLEQTRQGNRDVSAMLNEIAGVQQAVTQIAGSVKEFVESTRAIAGMTQQVKDIADQTNLLALNAAIEAARAGEQGRGFAVVADEVRKLAEKSALSANEIDRVTNSLDKKSGEVEATVQSGLRSLLATQEQVERVSAVLTDAGTKVENSCRGVSDIVVSVKAQSRASEEISRNVEKIAQMSEENHTAVELNTQEILRLEQLAKTLQEAVSRFRV
ncbi:MAG: methyl-accepting chemotaxis protein [Nitrosomonadales bacterium]